MKKKAIRYIRFSDDDQSQHSTERQQIVTDQWIRQNDVDLVDNFKDEGYSARTFDRPDVKQLFDFIKRNHRQIDYLVVSELTRFSRETGEAITMVKKIQSLYGIRIVSASRSQVYDVHDSSSFLMMGLEFLFGNTENIKRTADINGGIYTAKAVKGKYIHGGPAPYGYIKKGHGENLRLEVKEEEAAVVRYIFEAYLLNVPIKEIRENAWKRGFKPRGSSCIQQVLTNPLFMSYQQVKPWRDQPGGLFPIKDLPPIIDAATWHRVQEKINGPVLKKTPVDTLPLRGLLRCYCQKHVTGAASTNKIGKPYLYYKCAKSRHLNLSAPKAHAQLQEILSLMSIPPRLIKAIAAESSTRMERRILEKRQRLLTAKNDLEKIQRDIYTVEKKFIQEESINTETYHRWMKDLNAKRINAGAIIDECSRDEAAKWELFYKNLDRLSDLQSLYTSMPTTAKQELLRQVFDDRLYYQQHSYRTPFVMQPFTHNLLTLKNKHLLIVDGLDYTMLNSPVVWTPTAQNRTLDSLMAFISSLKVA